MRDEAHASHRRNLASASADHAASLERANGFVIVCWHGDPRRGTWAYEHFDSLNEAADMYSDYQRGEYRDFTPHAICAAKDGVPFARLSTFRIAELMAETQAEMKGLARSGACR